jgi:hypothetical protein
VGRYGRGGPTRQPLATGANVGQVWRNRGQPLHQPEFLRPVVQCQAKALDIRVAVPELRLDDRNLLAAARDSCRHSLAFLSDLFECPPVAVQRGLLVRQRLKPLHDNIDVFRIQLDAHANALRQFRGR